MKLSRRLALLAAPLVVTVVGLSVPATAAWAWSSCTSVVFTVQPTTTQVNTVMSPAVRVQVDQSNGQVDKAYNGPVTLTYADNPVGAPEPADNSVNAVQGVATISGLTFSAVGFGFELQASIPGGPTSSASSPFNVVSSLVQCEAGQSCRSGTVSSAGTSATIDAAAGNSGTELAATGGGFSSLSCTTYGGVVTYSAQNRSAVITLTLSGSALKSGGSRRSGQSVHWKHSKQAFNICWGSPTPFTTLNGSTSAFNAANAEYEGLLPFCRAQGGSEPCIQWQQQNKCRHDVVTTIIAPAGDPRMTY